MENENSNKIGIAIIYALVGALISGIIWGAIVIIFNSQLSIVALAVGGITGYAVAFAAKEHITQTHRIIAVIASLIGIVIGKYIGFAYLFNDGFERFLDPFTRASFGHYFQDLFGFADLIFILLAVIAAWHISNHFTQKKHQQVDIGNTDDDENGESFSDSSTISQERQDEADVNNQGKTK